VPPDTHDSAYPAGLRRFLAGAFALAVPVAAWSGVTLVRRPPDADTALEVGLFFCLALLADLRPVALDEDGGRPVSLAFVFILASQILFGWQYAVVIAALSILVPQLVERRPPERVAFNVAVYALAAFASALPARLVGVSADGNHTSVVLFAFVGGAAFVAVNIFLVCCAMGLFEGTSVRALLVDNIRHGGSAFVTMAFLAALAVTLWLAAPPLIVLMVGPILTLTLYQRSALATRIATRDAHTDSLTLLGNHRGYELALAESLSRIEADGGSVSVCLVDVDEFKAVNDIYGHPLGDAVLREVARRLLAGAPSARGFRFGGDEFALILECDTAVAHAQLERVQALMTEALFPHDERLTISIGVASFPEDASRAEELHRVADTALYWAKHHGKDQLCVYKPSIVRPLTPDEIESVAERRARLRAARNLVRVVDARDAYTGRHSESVSRLAAELAAELGLAPDTVEQVRLAGLLHDLGKIGIPDQILRKPTSLTAAETRLVQAHSELGASLLDGLDLAPVDTWVLHHHEHWDGSGYPHGLEGDDIPIGARIILACDAFHAMTSDRVYRAAMPVADAVAELRRCAGTHFDPEVAAALIDVVSEPA
jgi:diguanylate cyclase (GGDEF)-like protein/putative nucleotidyltransferase with HDIG domain